MTGRVILCDGIGEPQPNTLLAQADWSGLEVTHLRWSQSYGPVNPNHDPFGESFTQALGAGMTALRTELDRGPAFVAGYSGGAALAGHVAAQGHENLIAVGLVADPFQPPVIGGANVWGVAGRRPIWGHTYRAWTCPSDIICQAPADSPVRTFADQSAAFSLADPAAWTADLLNRLRTHRWQAICTNPFDAVGAWRRYVAAASGVGDYLGFEGHAPSHQSYALRIPGQPWTFAADELAAWAKGVLA